MLKTYNENVIALNDGSMQFQRAFVYGVRRDRETDSMYYNDLMSKYVRNETRSTVVVDTKAQYQSKSTW